MSGFVEGAPFGGLPVPDGVEILDLTIAVGTVTAARARPAVSRGRVLIVPGFTGSKEDHTAFLPLLAERGWDALSYSQRGQADSVAPIGAENYTLEAFASDVVEVAEAFGGGEPVHLVGHSLGGVISRAAVIRSPGSFLDETMLCSGPRGWPGRHVENETLAAEVGTSAIWDRDNPHTVGVADADLDPFLAFLRRRMRATSADNIVGGARILRSEEDTTDALAATGVPVLVAHGVWDAAWPIEWQRDMARRLDARYEVIPEAYHSPQAENPRATAAVLDDFWGARSR